MSIYVKMAHYSALNIEFIYMNTNEKFTYCHVVYLGFILEYLHYLLELFPPPAFKGRYHERKRGEKI